MLYNPHPELVNSLNKITKNHYKDNIANNKSEVSQTAHIHIYGINVRNK